MRNIYDVTVRIIDAIPVTEEDLIHDLKSILDSVKYSAPENIIMWWGELSMVIGNYLEPTFDECNEWQKEVALIISGKK
jgi:hypothetical protein